MNYQNVGGIPSAGIPVADKNSLYHTPNSYPAGLYQQAQQTIPGQRIAQPAAGYTQVSQAYAPAFYTPTTGYSALQSPYHLSAATGAYPGMPYSSIQAATTSPSFQPSQYSAAASYLASQNPNALGGLGATSAQYGSAVQGSQVVYPAGSISPAAYGAYASMPTAPGYQVSSMYPGGIGPSPSFPPGPSLYGPRF